MPFWLIVPARTETATWNEQKQIQFLFLSTRPPAGATVVSFAVIAAAAAAAAAAAFFPFLEPVSEERAFLRPDLFVCGAGAGAGAGTEGVGRVVRVTVAAGFDLVDLGIVETEALGTCLRWECTIVVCVLSSLEVDVRVGLRVGGAASS